MTAVKNPPTTYPEVNAFLDELLASIQTVLGNHMLGMYIEGSIASGDFDRDSDIDFVVVTDEEISGELFYALRKMHDRIAALDVWVATELEGSYLSQAALRRFDPANARHPRIVRDRDAHLEMVEHDEDWVIHQHILYERGLTLMGPAPQTLIDPVSPNALLHALLPRLESWAPEILKNPAIIATRGYQSYTVLTLCRMLYTLEHGVVVSKPVAARWAQATLGARWSPLIERTWDSRHNPGMQASLDDVNETLEFIRLVLERSQQYNIPSLTD